MGVSDGGGEERLWTNKKTIQINLQPTISHHAPQFTVSRQEAHEPPGFLPKIRIHA
jgi:hypothetical protein